MSRPSRRDLLFGLGALAVVVTSGPAFAETAGWQVSYCACSDLDEALDQLAEVEAVLGDDVARRMGVVLTADRSYHVVLPVEGGEAKAAALVTQHDMVLREAWATDEELATLIQVQLETELYNVSYGLGPNFDALKTDYDRVARMLGSGVARDLVIERTAKGNYALVYRRYGNLSSTQRVASKHDSLLRSVGVDASVIRHKNNAVVWSGSSAASPHVARVRIEPVVDPVDPIEDPPTVDPTSDIRHPIADAVMSSPDSPLAGAIEKHVKALRSAGSVGADEHTSWLVYDLESDITLASINVDVPRQCASMIKPLVALAYFHRVDAEELTYGDDEKAKFERMIQKSSNTSTDWAIKAVGGPNEVHALLNEHYAHLFQATEVVEYIGSDGRTYQNRASAGDLGRFLRALWNGELPQSTELKRLMNLPGRDRLFDGAPAIPVGTAVYNKTGSTARLCGDMGILVAQKAGGGTWAYAVVGIIEKDERSSSYTSWIRSRSKVVRSVSNLVYVELKEAEGLL